MLSAEHLARVESLGLNCEVGYVLRQMGNETPSLFRWTWAPPRAVLNLLRSDFAGLYNVESLVPGPSNMVSDKRYDVCFHTNLETAETEDGGVYRFLEPNESKRARILSAERSAIWTLVDQIRASIRRPDALFVLTRYDCEPEGSIEEIADEIRARRADSQFCLMEVREAPTPSLASHVEVVDRTLLRGYVARFAPYDAAHDIDLESWTALLVRAFAAASGDLPSRPARLALS